MLEACVGDRPHRGSVGGAGLSLHLAQATQGRERVSSRAHPDRGGRADDRHRSERARILHPGLRTESIGDGILVSPEGQATVNRVNREQLRNPGGTSGGLGAFLLGLVMAVAGGYLFIDRVTVYTSRWEWFGVSGFGMALVPLLFGIFFLFFNGKSIIGWLLTLVGVVIIFAGVIAS